MQEVLDRNMELRKEFCIVQRTCKHTKHEELSQIERDYKALSQHIAEFQFSEEDMKSNDSQCLQELESLKSAFNDNNLSSDSSEHIISLVDHIFKCINQYNSTRENILGIRYPN